MLFTFPGTCYLDKKPLAKDFAININHREKEARIRYEYISPTGTTEPVDLDIAYGTPKLTNPALTLIGEECIRGISFELELSWRLTKGGFYVSGKLDDAMINRPIANPLEFFGIIKSVL